MVRPFAALVLVGLAAECNRTPEEFPTQPAASATATAGASSATATASTASPAATATASTRGTIDAPSALAELARGRCIQPTPASPPPGVPPGPAPGCPVDPEGGPPPVPTARIAFPDAVGVAVDAEIVRSAHDTMRGLMYRKEMGPDRGMLFDLRVREDHKFWMHNTCIPLDILYVDDDGLVVGIVENAPTLNDESRGVGCPSRWVLEVNAGWTRRHGVKAGQRMTIPAEARQSG